MALVVITGAGSGIGAALSEALGARGHDLALIGRSGNVEATRERIRAQAASPAIWCLCGDLAGAEGRREVIEGIQAVADESRGVIDALVHAATEGEPSASLERMAVADVERSLAVNAMAPLALAQGLLPFLEAGPSASRILLLTSGVAQRPQPGTAAYGIGKAALERVWWQLQKDIDHEQCGECVAVGLFQPGIVDTPGLRDHIARARACGLPHADYLSDALAAGAARTPEAVAEAIRRLLFDTPAASFARTRWHARDLLAP